ncbi:hypothetical protein FRC02_003752, partial [Tulasnella sp. 418]
NRRSAQDVTPRLLLQSPPVIHPTFPLYAHSSLLALEYHNIGALASRGHVIHAMRYHLANHHSISILNSRHTSAKPNPA